MIPAAKKSWRAFRRNDAGTTAVEFALILAPFLMLVVGGFYVALLTFTASSLRYAVEAGARCASVNTTTCSNSATTISYARTQFGAANASSVTFASRSATCGHLVSGTMNYTLSTPIRKIIVPLSAQACFP